jgi:hypothetical protein
MAQAGCRRLLNAGDPGFIQACPCWMYGGGIRFYIYFSFTKSVSLRLLLDGWIDGLERDQWIWAVGFLKRFTCTL